MGLNKTTLTAKVAELSGLTKVDSDKAVRATLDAISAELAGGGDVKLIGFGSFSVVHKKERMGKNPQTGAAMKIPAKTVPKFKPGSAFVELVNAKAKKKAGKKK